MTVRPVSIFTTSAVIAMLAGDPVCDTCAGRGRLEVTSPRDKRTCPACGGRGIPRTMREWVYHGRSDFKAYRQATR